MPYTVAFSSLVKSMAPPKPQIRGDECPHASSAKLALCVGSSTFSVANAGRWIYQCYEGSCAMRIKWLSPSLDPYDIYDLANTLSADLSYSDRLLQHLFRSMKADLNTAEPRGVVSHHMDFNFRLFLSEILRDSGRAREDMPSWALIWTQLDQDPIPFLYSLNESEMCSTMYTFELSAIPSWIEAGDGDKVNYLDVLTGHWIEIGNSVTFPRRAGEILCLKTSNIRVCKGLDQVQQYHRAVFQRLVSDLALLP